MIPQVFIETVLTKALQKQPVFVTDSLSEKAERLEKRLVITELYPDWKHLQNDLDKFETVHRSNIAGRKVLMMARAEENIYAVITAKKYIVTGSRKRATNLYGRAVRGFERELKTKESK